MKLRLLLLFASAVPLFWSGCFTRGSQIGAGAGLNPAAVPVEAGGMAGPAAGTAPVSGGPAADGGSGAEDTDRSPTDGATDPTSGADTPITIVGSPTGGSRKPTPCRTSEFRLCFHDVTITAVSGEAGGPLHYEISGFLATQPPGGGEMTPVWDRYIRLIDILFPDNLAASISHKPLGDFSGSADAPAGRGIRFEAQFCRHTTTLDVVLPELSDSPLVVDPCGGTDPTDVNDGPGPRGHPWQIDQEFQFETQMKAQ